MVFSQITLKQFKNDPVIVLYLYNNFFRCCWRFDRETQLMKFDIYYLEPVHEETEFQFEMVLIRDGKAFLNKIGIIKEWEPSSGRIFEPKCVYDYDTLTKFYNKEGNGLLCINIHVIPSK